MTQRLMGLLLVLCGCAEGSGEAPQRVERRYASGKIFTVSFVRNGKLEGTCTMYYESGKVQAVQRYGNNVLQGKATTYYPTGLPKNEATYVDNVIKGPYKGFRKDGTLETEGLIDAFQKTEWKKTYYASGQLRSVITLSAGQANGPFVEYRLSGKKKAEGRQRHNKIDGLLTYHDSLSTDSVCVRYVQGKLVERVEP